ncbi:MAG: hypothetical protein DRI23_10145 [Candidatus Cloacimonadota bacterium]|nr:MAG: hypothetical protein DRI23_10145 [Candidatus Cloacimonadota bacterium]
MKHEWRKHEKDIYLPKQKPVLINIPAFNYFTIEGKGNPNDVFFAEYIGVLYSLAYAAKMSSKKGITLEGYFDYTVYPLEGVWDISDKAKQNYSGKLNKNDLVFKLMIRQPEFVTHEFADQIIDITKKKKPHKLLEEVKYETIEEGKCVQMLHVGSYDSEPASFAKMEEFCEENELERFSKKHREIYLSDARKVVAEKLKTVLRYKV